jgi:hypothetical protein
MKHKLEYIPRQLVIARFEDLSADGWEFVTWTDADWWTPQVGGDVRGALFRRTGPQECDGA